MSNSRCKHQVILLDCCFSGAFAEGMTAKDDGTVDVQNQVGREGRVVLTSSTSTQYSFEQKGSDLSVYTHYIVEGIETGAADTNGDGSISIDELHEYARKKVQEVAPAMKPKIYAVEEGFKIRLAKTAVGDPKLIYRKEVEYVTKDSNGEINFLDRGLLDELRIRLNLSNEETSEIEVQVLKPYQERQEKLNRYEQYFSQAIQSEYPLRETTRNKLDRLLQVLQLQKENVVQIEALLLAQHSLISNKFEKVIGFDGRDIVIKIDLLESSVLIRCAETAVFVTVTRSSKRGANDASLSVSYREHLQTMAQVVGRNPEEARLIQRLLDRSLRPLFPENFQDSIRVVATTLSIDDKAPPDVFAITGISIALMLAKIPVNYPIASVRIGLIGDDFVANPTYREIKEGNLNMVVVASTESVIMVETEPNQLPEQDIAEAIDFAHEAIRDLIQAQRNLMQELNVKQIK